MKINIDGKVYTAAPYSREPLAEPPKGYVEGRSVSVNLPDLPFAKSSGVLFINKDKTLVRIYASGSLHPYYVIVEGL